VPGNLVLAIDRTGDLCYNNGRGTLMSYRQSKLDYYSERYFFHVVNWARARWEVDAARISGYSGMSMHLAIRHPEIFGVYHSGGPNFFENDFDQKWNPACLSLRGRIGPVEIVKTPDGSAPGWSLFDISWYLKQDPGKDIPFIVSLGPHGKDIGHSAEYGWQDDPKGYAALRDARQPFVANWGSGISPKLRDMLFKMRWDKSVPAFSRCSLDNNPGNGDADDGDVIGQINGYLMWDYDTIVDAADKWEMTVTLTADAPAKVCVVDVTPRHRKAFNPRPGEKHRYTNTSLADNKVVQSGQLAVDEWGLVTIPQALVFKGGNRLVIGQRK
jgi:hypothetical protein